MARRNRIPEENSAFNAYINNTAAALLSGTPATWQQLELREDDKNKWLDFTNQWNSTYTQYTDLAQRTRAIVSRKNNIRKGFTKFAQPLLTLMSVKKPGESDRVTFNLSKEHRPYHKRGQITEAPVAEIEPIGGGLIRMRILMQNHQGRSRRHPLADMLEICYWYGPRVSSVPLEQCTHRAISTKSYFIFKMPAQANGNWAFFYFRWVNYSKSTNNGPFSNMYISVVG